LSFCEGTLRGTRCSGRRTVPALERRSIDFLVIYRPIVHAGQAIDPARLKFLDCIVRDLVQNDFEQQEFVVGSATALWSRLLWIRITV
jgi:hypothetical protein